jgi:hypothetical protein
MAATPSRASAGPRFVARSGPFLLHLGYFGPVLMGILDSSFLFLPFGNDLLVVTLMARHHQGWLWYVLAAAVGSTIGVFALALVAQKLKRRSSAAGFMVHVDGATIHLKANCRVDDIETNNGRRRIDGCPPSSETLNIAYPLSRFLRLLNLANSVLRLLPSA